MHITWTCSPARSLRAFSLGAALLVAASAPAHAAAGDLDPAFGRGGRVWTDFNQSTDIAHAVALQADGKILVGGTSYLDNDFSGEDFAIARYNADGGLDATFGANGRVLTPFAGLAAQVSALVVQPDGKILAVGGAYPLFAFAGNFALARYNTDGSLDAGFGNGGVVTTNFDGHGSYASAVALQPDGKIIAGGTAFVAFSFDETSSDTDFGLARYNTDGSLDTSFGTGGRVTTDFGGFNDDAFAVLLQPDGRIVAVGSALDPISHYDFAVARYRSDGTLDASFGEAGRVRTDSGARGFDRARAAVLQPDGKIVAAGFAISRNGGSADFAVVRYRRNGTLDTGFGAGGKRPVDFGSCCQSANSVLLQADGKIVVAGYPDSESADSDFVLARLQADGSLDRGFGVRGKVRTSFGRLNGGANAAVLQPDGNIVAAGFQATNTPQWAQFALARYLGR